MADAPARQCPGRGSARSRSIRHSSDAVRRGRRGMARHVRRQPLRAAPREHHRDPLDSDRPVPILLLVIILGIVEGITEYLPVSSTGHLILATELLGFKADDWAVFNIAIQPGAILAVVVLYWRTFWDVIVGMFHKSPSAWAFVRNVFVAFIPAVVLGLAFGDAIEMMLSNAIIVCWALIIGGGAILILEKTVQPKESG